MRKVVRNEKSGRNAYAPPAAYLLIRLLECSAQFLFTFNRLEEGLEIPFSEALRPFALNDFEEHCWTIQNRFGEDLQEIPFVVTVNQNAQLLQWC